MNSSTETPWGALDVVQGVALAAVAGVVLVLAALALDRAGLLQGLMGALVISAALQIALLAVALRLSIGKYGAPAEALGFGRSVGLAAWTAPFAGLAAVLLVTAGYVFVIENLGWDALQPSGIPEEIAAAEGFARLAAAFVIIVLGPVAEETFFRGFVFQGLRARLGGWGAAAASSALFAAVHGELGVLLPAFLSGLVLVWVFLRAGRLGPAILAHSLYNFVALIVVWR